MGMRRTLAATLLVLGCTDPPPAVGLDASARPDARDEARDDAMETSVTPDVPTACTEAVRVHSVLPEQIIVGVGAPSRLLLRLALDRAACDATFHVESSDPAVLSVPSSVVVARGHGSATLAVQGVAAGTVRLRITQTDPADPAGVARVEVPVEVRAASVPTCPVGASDSLGVLHAGGAATTAATSTVGAAGMTIPAGTTGLPTDAVSVACADLTVPDGWDALGPAVAFGPGAARFSREVGFTVPANAARVPTLYEGHVELLWSPPGPTSRPRIVSVADAHIDAGGRSVSFAGYRLGTYRAVVRHGLGATHVTRRRTFHAIYGISMGAVGTSMIGTHHPELFDVLAPLGGPADAAFSSAYLRRWVYGGFCTEAQRSDPSIDCSSSSADRTPVPDDLGMVGQHFERFFAPPGGGTGGTFDRQARFQGFRDIARMFGNAVMGTDPTTAGMPFGVPASETVRTDADRCAHPVVLGGPGAAMDQRFYDDEYDPDGRFAAITFCDGGRAAGGDVGQWDGSAGTYPVEITLAVDRNGNGRRDPGEPVVRNFSEPFRDVGADGRASADEPGFDARTNPDPAGDDYDREYNPAGAEGNFRHDDGEPWDDLGLDGVPCPAGRRCPYDQGEGNGRFDLATSWLPGADANDPRVRFAAMSRDEAARLRTWIDGGVRDALQFGVNANHFAGAVAQQAVGLHVVNGFVPLLPGHRSTPEAEDAFDPGLVDWARVPSHTALRYGSLDASPARIAAGDGAHVGTTLQIAARLLSGLYAVQSTWPDADRALTGFSTSVDNDGRCAHGYQCAFSFVSERTGRSGPVSIVLPPGYHDPENAGARYPVVYLLHGYGMEPGQFSGAALVAASRMVARQTADWQRPGKFIFVFPDGRCRPGDGCLEGTFFVDSVAGNAQMETYFLDLYHWVDATFRVRAPATVDEVE